MQWNCSQDQYSSTLVAGFAQDVFGKRSRDELSVSAAFAASLHEQFPALPARYLAAIQQYPVLGVEVCFVTFEPAFGPPESAMSRWVEAMRQDPWAEQDAAIGRAFPVGFVGDEAVYCGGRASAQSDHICTLRSDGAVAEWFAESFDGFIRGACLASQFVRAWTQAKSVMHLQSFEAILARQVGSAFVKPWKQHALNACDGPSNF